MNDLVKIVQQSGLESVEQTSIMERFGDYEAVAKEWEAKAKAIVVTSASQTTEMAMAKEARKKFSQMRIDIEKARKAMKEQSLRKGQAIDSVAKFLVSLIAPIEEYLKSQEDYVLIETQKRVAEEKKKAEEEAEKKRLEEEEAERLEQERIKKENEKLKKEAEENEKKLKEEKEKAEAERIKAEKEKKELAEKALAKENALKAEQEAKLKKEKEAREKAEAEKQAIIDEQKRVEREAEEAEQARLKEIEDAKKLKSLQSDSLKFQDYVNDLLEVEIPELTEAEYKEKVELIKSHITKFKLVVGTNN